MLLSHKVRRLATYFRTFLNALFRYLSFPLRVVHRLFRGLLQLHSRVISTRLRRIGTHGPSDRVAGSSQPPILPQRNDQLPLPPEGLLASNVSLPISPPPTVSSSTQALQPSSAVLEVPNFEPLTPSEVKRYKKQPTIKPNGQTKMILPLMRDYSDICGGGNWCARVHPEGALYFHDDVRGIYTDSDLQSQKQQDRINSCIAQLLDLAGTLGLNLTGGADIELVVLLLRDPRSSPNPLICKYYFVDHSKRLLFWVHVQLGEKLFDGIQGVEKMSHIKYAVEQHYWWHCEMYPNKNLPGPMLLKELREIVVHASAETITTDLSLSPFNGDELSKILDLIGQLQENLQGECNAHSISVIARFMRYFTRAKFFNFYGLPTARLNADQSIYVKEKSHKLMSAFSWAFNVALFGAPESHMSELRRVWVDRAINYPRWKNFNDKLRSEWSGITMYSTVMIAVDVSFLAVPSVMPPNNSSLPPQVISTYISVFCITGSLVVSLFLTRQNRHQESAHTAVEFLTQMTGPPFGTKALATVYGLPYALLLWGMVYFLLAFSYQVFSSTSAVTLATTGSACGLVMLFMLWLIRVARDFHLSTWLTAWLRSYRSKASYRMKP